MNIIFIGYAGTVLDYYAINELIISFIINLKSMLY